MEICLYIRSQYWLQLYIDYNNYPVSYFVKHLYRDIRSSSIHPIYSVHKNYDQGLWKDNERRQIIPIKKDAIKESVGSRKISHKNQP